MLKNKNKIKKTNLVAVSSCSIAAPLLLSLLLLLWMLPMMTLQRPVLLLCGLACVWVWILCPELMSVTIRTQTNSTACNQKPQPANTPEQVRKQKWNYLMSIWIILLHVSDKEWENESLSQCYYQLTNDACIWIIVFCSVESLWNMKLP